MTNRYDQERLGELLRLLRPAPAGWLSAAQELPAARRSLDGIIARAEADAEFRKTLIADLEQALAHEGIEPDRAVVEQVRKRLSQG